MAASARSPLTRIRLLSRLSLFQAQTSFSSQSVDGGSGVVDDDVSTSDPGNPRRRELERRIEELEAYDEAAFGHFTAWDWIVCTVFCLGLPLLAILWWAA